NQGRVWYFGDHAGLDFTGGITPVSGSAMYAFEGAASIGDNDGNILFYTNGVNLYDADNNIMPNGSGLAGELSSSQTLIIQSPGNCKTYYVFTPGSHLTPLGGIWYSKVDLSMNGGKGDIPAGEKNIELLGASAEGISCALQINNHDIWILTHGLGSNNFYVYPITDAGIGAPVISSIGPVRNESTIIGCLKASHKGTQIAMTYSFTTPGITIHNFNRATGQVTSSTDIKNLFPSISSPYGIEFSSNDKMLYVTDCFSTNYLYQLNLNTYVATQLAAQAGDYHFGQLQMARNGKIYMANNGNNYVGCITKPGINGLGCNYVANSITLAPGTFSSMGMTNQPPYIYNPFYLANDPCTPGLTGEENERSFYSSQGDKLVVYPNPVRDHLFFNNENLVTDEMEFEIYDINGKLIKSTYCNDFIFIGEIPQGIYLIRSGIYSAKFIKN
ncbi:MAG: T9SS type A sorting domain-containing protein, partial [Chitinophagales bacterium]